MYYLLSLETKQIGHCYGNVLYIVLCVCARVRDVLNLVSREDGAVWRS